jgi:hypothetical protein
LKLNKNRLIASVFVFFIVITIVGFSLNDDKAVLFKIPYPAELLHKSAQSKVTTDSGHDTTNGTPFNCNETQTTKDGKPFCGNVENLSIYCQAKISTDVTDIDGNTIRTLESKFLKGNPVTTFSFIETESQKDLSGYNVISKIKCDTPATGLLGLDQVPVIVKANTMAVHVYSKALDGKHLVDTYNAELVSNKVTLDNNQEVVLGESFIQADRILQYMDDGNYDSIQHIVLDGDYLIAWKGYENIPYRLSTTTTLTYNSNDQIVSVDADIITTNKITVDVGGSSSQPKQCKPNEVLKSGVCVGAGDSGNGGGGDDIIITSSDLLTKFTNCALSNPDKGCLASAEFSPFYLLGVGLVAIVSASKPQSRQVVYGMQ